MHGDEDRHVPLATRFWVSLARAYRLAYRRHSRALAALGVSVSQFDLLATLHRSRPEGLRMGELSDRLLVTEGNVTGLVDRLQGAGMVERHADPADRRAFRVRLTPAGRALAERAIPVVEAELERVFAGLAPEEMRQAQRVLRRARRSAEGAGDG
ncbi:MAG TPA: MarR family transcriptional regulator [Longimicrobiaceae bacterium]|nr:MarR family transcriptional regulator [Longimicrobiaceae bacterium]